MHPGTRLKALQGSSIRKHPAIKPTSSTNEGMTGATLNYLISIDNDFNSFAVHHAISR